MTSVLKAAGAVGSSLYETDFHAWTQREAALLRDGRVHALDLANLLEEVEALGRKERAELKVRLRILLAHLLQKMFQPEKAGRSWATTILAQRIAIADHLADNPSLKASLADVFAKAYADARDLAASETGLAAEVFPTVPPFTYEEAVTRPET